MADAAIRVAVASDSEEIARIQATTWRTAYADLLPAEVLDGMDEKLLTRQWQDAVSSDNALVLVATEADWTVGFCVAGRAPEQEIAAADGSLPPDAEKVALVSALHVEPRWGRRGHGGRLLGEMATRLHQHGATRAVTWVPEVDQVTLAFFHSVGWEPDGTVRTLDAAGQPVRELRVSGSLQLRFEAE